MTEAAIKEAIAASRDKIREIDEKIIGQSIGVSTAINELRKGLSKIEDCLQKREYYEASNIGYREVSSSFVFLQRALGGIQGAMADKEELVSEIALQSGVNVYEEVEPLVNEIMASAKILTEEERQGNKVAGRK